MDSSEANGHHVVDANLHAEFRDAGGDGVVSVTTESDGTLTIETTGRMPRVSIGQLKQASRVSEAFVRSNGASHRGEAQLNAAGERATAFVEQPEMVDQLVVAAAVLAGPLSRPSSLRPREAIVLRTLLSRGTPQGLIACYRSKQSAVRLDCPFLRVRCHD